ncbi:MAG: hypothetical protein V9E89_18295 [Ilumatobacteraceae bacterium]|jgi:hypothetical protein
MTPTFVALSYVLTFGGTGALVAAMMRRARRLGKQVPPQERPWT